MLPIDMIYDSSYYLRNPDVLAIGTADCYLLVDAEGSVVNLPSRHPALWSQLMQTLMVPTRGDVLRAELSSLVDMDAMDPAMLLERGVLLQAPTPDELEARRDRVFTHNQGYYLQRGEPQCGHLIVALTGSITAGLMAPVILSLCYSGFHGDIDLILTPAALQFANRDLFEFYGIRTWVDAFERRDHVHVPHVALGQSADCLLVMPASAACCRRLADGACSDLLSMTVAATGAPVVLAPVMNTAMWNHAAVQRNIQQLRADGLYVIEPTLIFSANDLAQQGEPMYGGPGTFWRGALGVMQALVATMDHHQKS